MVIEKRDFLQVGVQRKKKKKKRAKYTSDNQADESIRWIFVTINISYLIFKLFNLFNHTSTVQSLKKSIHIYVFCVSSIVIQVLSFYAALTFGDSGSYIELTLSIWLQIFFFESQFNNFNTDWIELNQKAMKLSSCQFIPIILW